MGAAGGEVWGTTSDIGRLRVGRSALSPTCEKGGWFLWPSIDPARICVQVVNSHTS